MSFTRITSSDTAGHWNADQADTPGLSATEFKTLLDYISRSVIIPKHNSLISEMEATTGAASIGAVVPSGIDAAGNNVQAILNAIMSSIMKKEHPVGSMWISADSTSPSTVFGFGTWTQVTDKYLMAAGSSHTAGSSGGNSSITLDTKNLPSHTHEIPSVGGTAASSGAHTHSVSTNSGTTGASDVNHTHTFSGNTGTESAMHTHNSIIPNQSQFAAGKYGSFWAVSGGNSGQWDSANNTVNQTDGESATHNHAYSGTTSGANYTTHTHSIPGLTGTAASAGAHTHSIVTNAATSGSAGSGAAVTIEPKYYAVYIWQRTA